MVIRKGTKDKQYSSFSCGHCIVYPLFLFLWPLYCLSFVPFLMAIVLFILCSFSYDHCIVYPLFLFLWPLYCLSLVPFLMAIVLFILCSFSYGLCIVYPLFLFLCPLYCLSLKDKQYNGYKKRNKG
jgi:hypothetical protein